MLIKNLHRLFEASHTQTLALDAVSGEFLKNQARPGDHARETKAADGEIKEVGALYL